MLAIYIVTTGGNWNILQCHIVNHNKHAQHIVPYCWLLALVYISNSIVFLKWWELLRFSRNACLSRIDTVTHSVRGNVVDHLLMIIVILGRRVLYQARSVTDTAIKPNFMYHKPSQFLKSASPNVGFDSCKRKLTHWLG